MRKRSKTLSVLGIFLIIMSIISFIVFYIIVMISNRGYTYVDTQSMELVQINEIKEGAPTAIIDTTLGEFRVVLYPEYAPETVKMFTDLAEAGYYDGTYVFEAKQDVYFAAGTADAYGNMPDEIIEGQEHVPQELHQNLWPFRGAMCAITTSVEGGFFKRLFHNTQTFTGSRFMLLGSVDFSDEEFVEEFREASGNEVLTQTFLQWGGIPNFAQQMTVFGQTYAGLDVIDAICGAPLVETENLKGYTPPAEDVQILSVTISTYTEEDAARNELEPPVIELPEETAGDTSETE